MKTILIFGHKKLYRSINTLNTKLLYIRENNGYYVGVFKSNRGEEHIVHISVSGDKFYCTCNYYLITGEPCKHIVSMLLELQKHGMIRDVLIKK